MAKKTPKRTIKRDGAAKIFSTRLQPDLREALEREAKRKGRPLSQEVQNRLRQTFVEEEQMIDRFGSERTARVLQTVASVLRDIRNPENPQADWLDDPRAFDYGLSAIMWTLEVVRPPQPPDWYQLEWIRTFDSPSKRHPYTDAGREVWREIASSDDRSLPLKERLTPKQRLASIIRNKIPDIVERSRTLAPGTPLATVTAMENSNYRPRGLPPDVVEAFNEVRREHYLCVYCDDLYPKEHGPQCPRCKGLALSGEKHGGDGRQLKLFSPTDVVTTADITLAEDHFAEREWRKPDREVNRTEGE
jgi:hypothetical protein